MQCLSDDESFNDSNSDDESSDGMYASRLHKTTRKMNRDDDDKKFFTSLPACYSMFSAFFSQDVIHSYCPFTKLNKCCGNRTRKGSGDSMNLKPHQQKEIAMRNEY